MHTPETLQALSAKEFLNLVRGYEPAEIESLMSWLWGKPQVLAAGLNYLDRCREFITDSERTCDQANPVTGAWCYKPAPHADHYDTDGGTWTTERVPDPIGFCGHAVTPGAFKAGFTRCRDCQHPDQRDGYDRATAAPRPAEVAASR